MWAVVLSWLKHMMMQLLLLQAQCDPTTANRKHLILIRKACRGLDAITH